MTRLVALLRGINVGGNKRVPMGDLAEVAVGLGWQEPRTHLNSGNLWFTSADAPVDAARRLSDALHARFGFVVDVVVVEVDRVRRVAAGCPFEGDPKQVNVAFCSGEVDADQAARLAALAVEGERVAVAGDVVYVDFGGGLARSKLAAGMAQALRPLVVTTRNIRTVGRLASGS